MATWQQREHQWITPTVLSQGNGPLDCQSSSIGRGGEEAKYPPAEDVRLEDSSRRSGNKCFDDPLRPSYPCDRNRPPSDLARPARFELPTPWFVVAMVI